MSSDFTRTVKKSVSDDEFAAAVQKIASDFFQKDLVIEKVFSRKTTADDSLKFLLADRTGQACFFASCSTPVNPSLIQRGSERAEQIQSHLTADLGKHVLTADLVGSWEGMSYAIYPYCHPLPSGRIRRFITRALLRKHLLTWMFDTSKATMTLIEGDDRDRTLEYLMQAQSKKVSPALKAYCKEAQNKIESFDLRPYHTFCHNDLWEGNILLGSEKKGGEEMIGARRLPTI